MKKIVLFASGNGSNAEKIIIHFKNSPLANVVCVLSNNPRAKVLEKAEFLNVQTVIFNKEDLDKQLVLNTLLEIKPDLIVLCGFLLKFPESIINHFPNQVINIHPALLPKYGGKGMYGKYVHEAIFKNTEKETGITIHYVNENYDEGAFIFQKAINIEQCSSAEEIAQEVHKLEHKYFSNEIEKLLTQSI